MIEYLIAICLLLLTVGHAILIHGCMTWTKERRATTAGLEDKLATLATLIDEGLDMLNDAGGVGPSSSAITPASFDLKEMLTAALISKISNAPEHGSTQNEERPIHEEDDTQTEEAEV
jgi:hypothetical protein